MQEDRSPPSVPSSRSTSSPGSGYIQFDDKTVCGEFWDMSASEVVCRELGWGPPVDVAGYATGFLGSQINNPAMSCRFDMAGGGEPLYLLLCF